MPGSVSMRLADKPDDKAYFAIVLVAGWSAARHPEQQHERPPPSSALDPAMPTRLRRKRAVPWPKFSMATSPILISSTAP